MAIFDHELVKYSFSAANALVHWLFGDFLSLCYLPSASGCAKVILICVNNQVAFISMMPKPDVH